MQLQTVSFCICSYSCLTITALSNPSSNIVVQGYRVHPRLNLHFFVSCSSYRTLISEKRLEYHFYLAILKMKGTITGFLSVSLPPIFSFNPFFNYNKHDLQCKSDHVSSLQKKTFHDSASLWNKGHSSMVWPQSTFPASPIFFQSPHTQHYSIFNFFYLFKLSMIAFASRHAIHSSLPGIFFS